MVIKINIITWYDIINGATSAGWLQLNWNMIDKTMVRASWFFDTFSRTFCSDVNFTHWHASRPPKLTIFWTSFNKASINAFSLIGRSFFDDDNRPIILKAISTSCGKTTLFIVAKWCRENSSMHKLSASIFGNILRLLWLASSAKKLSISLSK